MTPPTIITLLIALGGPPMLTIASKRATGESSRIVDLLPFDLALWGLLAIVLITVTSVERQPLASIGLRRPGWSTLGWGLLLGIFTTFLIAPAMTWVAARLGFPGYEKAMGRMAVLPVWYRAFLAVTAGIVEEVLYRGYAVERLALLTGSYWLGGSIAVVAFGFAHVPGWGPGPGMVALVAGAVATAFYVWKRDLVATIVAHVLGDLVGLILLPPASSG